MIINNMKDQLCVYSASKTGRHEWRVGFGIGYLMFPNLTNKITSPFMNNEFKIKKINEFKVMKRCSVEQRSSSSS